MTRLKPLCLAMAMTGLIVLPASGTIVTVVKVTTFDDENGENLSACSLREAIKANNDLKPFGGCDAGDRYLLNTIQLQDGVYKLRTDAGRGTLIPTREVRIQGHETNDIKSVNPLTGSRPKVNPPKTVLDGQNLGRLFDTRSMTSTLTLAGLIIQGGSADKGGAIIAGGPIVAEKVFFKNNTATSEGGAIYLSGPRSTLTATQSTFEANRAPVGAVLGMTCMDNLLYAARTVEMTQTAILRNGDDTALSIVEGCGNLTLNLTTTTIAKNTATSTRPDSAILRLVERIGFAAHSSLTQVTAAENSAGAFYAYKGVETIGINSSVIAFNTGLGCKDFATPSNTRLSGDYNSLSGCPFDTATAVTRNINLDTHADATMANELEPLGFYDGISENYLPRLTSQYILDKGLGRESCIDALDQRGAYRNSYLQCDRGAVERKQLTAITDLNNKNKDGSDRVAIIDVLANDFPTESLTDRGSFSSATHSVEVTKGACTVTQCAGNGNEVLHIAGAQTGFCDFVNQSVSETAKSINFSGASGRSADFTLNTDGSAVNAVKITDGTTTYECSDTDRSLNRRCHYLTLRDDRVILNGVSLKQTKGGSASVVATGTLFRKLDSDTIVTPPNVRPFLVLQSKGLLTAVGKQEECHYQIRELSSGKISNETMVAVQFSNLTPTAQNDEVTLAHGATSVTVDVLANDDDDGDGVYGGLFHLADENPATALNIKITQAPELGSLSGEREGLCPDNTSVNSARCLGGKITYRPYNTLSPFSDSFQYAILDRDLDLSSPAEVKINNTADKRSSVGGGSLGWLSLGALAMMAARRIRRRNRE